MCPKGSGRPRTRGWPDGRHQPADHYGIGGLRGLRGGFQGLQYAAHAADVGSQRDPRHHFGGCHHRCWASRPSVGAGRGPAGRGSCHGEPRGRLRGDGPDAGNVPRKQAQEAAGGSAGRGCQASRNPDKRNPRPRKQGERPVSLLDPTIIALLYLAAAVFFILALKGLNSPRTARRGNLIGAFGALVAVVTVFFSMRLDNVPWILGAIAVGSGVAAPVARRVKMTQMPQLVALFNGVGGGAAALVALLELPHAEDTWVRVAVVFTMLVGAVSFAGSAVTFAKLQELITTRPVVFPGLPALMGAVLLAAVGAATAVVLGGWLALALVLLLLGLVAGMLLVLPVGGADVPIVISLLNAFTGLTVAAGGYVLENVVLLVAGTLVGASGTFLTLLMARAMGRSVANILFGALKGGSTLGAGVASDRPVKSANPEDVGILLAYAERVIIVPGYGLAVAQAQHTLRELVDNLIKRGIRVDYA